MQPKTSTLTAGFEMKALDDSGLFEGYASVFEAVDEGRDAVMPGAFKASIEERGIEGIKLLWQHDPAEPIGRLEEIYEDDRGLYIKGRLLLTLQRAREAMSLMRDGALDGLSIGFRTLKSRMDETKNVRLLLAVDLWEVSLVTFPMQPEARIAVFKKAPVRTVREIEALLRDAGGLSRMEAKALIASGFRGRGRTRDAAAPWSDLLHSLTRLERKILTQGD
ncbi:MAG TPA: HK97 family phage prohead protease [Sphingomonadales bacterium]|nr:HK97 family phage prohead protease [Sphingomonadales bacterium]